MKTAIVFISAVLALGQCASITYNTTCSTVNSLSYSQILKPTCGSQYINFYNPYYQNFGQFYACNGVGNPVLVNCAAGEYYTHALQACKPCAQFLPSPTCDNLRTANVSNCFDYNGGNDSGESTDSTGTPGNSEPTPLYPNSTVTTAAPTTASTAAPTTAKTTVSTAAPTTASTAAPTTASTAAPTTTTAGPASTLFPPAPSEGPGNPDAPMPPTPAPTPPVVEVTPPSIS